MKNSGNNKKNNSGESSKDTAGIPRLLNRHGIQARKGLGQNFLIDRNITSKIVDCSGIGSGDCVLEIGPGPGTLTWKIASTVGRDGQVVAVELDSRLIPVLKAALSSHNSSDNYENAGKVKIVEGDILRLDLDNLVSEFFPGKPVYVIANLPYYITTPVIMRLLESSLPFKSLTLMVQKEVADRILSAPGRKSYGALSLAVSYRASASLEIIVPPDCFYPAPTVTSAVIRLDYFKKPPVNPLDEAFLFKVIRASFLKRRKTLCNALYKELNIDKAKTAACLSSLGIRKDVRGEQLSLKEFSDLSDRLL